MYLIALDEVGRGAWAGSLFAGLVVIHEESLSHLIKIGVKDSKKLTPLKREILYPQILSLIDFYAVDSVSVSIIDSLGVYESTKLLFMNIVKRIPEQFVSEGYNLVVDGVFKNLTFYYKGKFLKHCCVIKADEIYPYVSAASILAKVSRDKYMKEISPSFPVYNFNKNKGYGTKDHLQAIKSYGICELHRKSFKPIKDVVNKFELFN